MSTQLQDAIDQATIYPGYSQIKQNQQIALLPLFERQERTQMRTLQKAIKVRETTDCVIKFFIWRAHCGQQQKSSNHLRFPLRYLKHLTSNNSETHFEQPHHRHCLRSVRRAN